MKEIVLLVVSGIIGVKHGDYVRYVNLVAVFD